MLSLVIPAYNEENRLPKTLESVFSFLNSEQIEAEVIVVNDGSKDNTEKIARELANSHSNLKVISYPDNKGKGKAVKTGVMEARGDFIIFLDADNSTSLHEIKSMKELLEEGHNLVIGSRKIKGAKILKYQPFLRRTLGSGFNWFVKVILGLSDYSDTQCGFKGFRREVAREIFSKSKISGFAFDTELLCIASILGYETLEIPIVWQDEKESTVKLKSVWNIFCDVLKIKYNSLRGVYGKEKILNRWFIVDLLVAIILSELVALLASLVLQDFLKIGNSGKFVQITLPAVSVLMMFLSRFFSVRIYEFTKFIIVGAANTAIDFWVLNYLSFSFNAYSGPLVAFFNIISFSVSVLNSYIFNKFWTFKPKRNKALPEFLIFLIVSIAAAAISTAIMFSGTTLFQHAGGDYFWLNFVKLIAVIFSTFINFLGYKFLVFKK